MRTRLYHSIIVLLLATLFVSSCKGTSSGTSAAPDSAKNVNSSNPEATPVQSGASSNPAEATPARETGATPQLAGTYVMTEVQDGGVATIISELKTAIHFSADGTYTRASSKKGTVYHTDSGQFRIDGGDKLVLTIQVSKKGMESQMHNPPLQKVHKFTLSSGGDELRMTSGKGKVALFRRSGTFPK